MSTITEETDSLLRIRRGIYYDTTHVHIDHMKKNIYLITTSKVQNGMNSQGTQKQCDVCLLHTNSTSGESGEVCGVKTLEVINSLSTNILFAFTAC